VRRTELYASAKLIQSSKYCFFSKTKIVEYSSALRRNRHGGSKPTSSIFSWIPYKPTTAQRCRSATEKFILEDLFSLVMSQFKKYRPPGNLKFNYLGIFQSLKLRILMGKFLSISLKLNFTPNTLGCYGLNECIYRPVSCFIQRSSQ